ncbi:hypothetical protein AB1Y20_023320 [Prymnesium parvum]
MAAPPVPSKPQPKPQLKAEHNPIPEFMWCQRSDRVYVTVKVSDCTNARVNVTADHVLEFSGTGHGMCGLRDYALRLPLFGGVVPAKCGWFVSGPGVRVRLEKEKIGPYWSGLLKGNQKMVHCKVDWQSWLDEDEETEVSRAPNGFEVEALCFNMMGESDALYRDPDKFSSSESEGEEENSVMMDEGMHSLDDMQVKFKALEEEKEARAHSQTVRRELRRKTRAAQLMEKQIARDKQHGRPTRELTAEELDLLRGASTLHDRLKKEKAVEKEYWQSKFHHQRRPERKKQLYTEKMIREEAKELAAEEMQKLVASGGNSHDKVARKPILKRVYLAILESAKEIFDRTEITSEKPWRIQEEKEGRLAAAKELARKVAEEEVARAAGEEVQEFLLPADHFAGVWEVERKALGLPKAKTDDNVPPEPDGTSDGECDLTLEENPRVREIACGAEDAGEVVLEENPHVREELGCRAEDDGELVLEENPRVSEELNCGAEGDDGDVVLEENPRVREDLNRGAEDDDGEVVLEENPRVREELNCGADDDDCEVVLEENPRVREDLNCEAADNDSEVVLEENPTAAQVNADSDLEIELEDNGPRISESTKGVSSGAAHEVEEDELELEDNGPGLSSESPSAKGTLL